MKRKKSCAVTAATFLLAIGFCLCFAGTSFATIVYFDATGPIFEDVGSIQFSILGPIETDTSSFTPNFPTGWLDFSSGNLVSAFDLSGVTSLQNGVVGTFNSDVILGNFELAHQSSEVIGSDLYNIVVDGSDYRISNVPVPPALLLLGSGLVGILGFRRKIMK